MTEISAMYEALDNMDDYALLANVKPIGPHKVLTDAIAELETLRQRVVELEYQLNTEIGSYASQQITGLTTERDALKKLYESSEESVLALKETRNRLAEERDKATQYWQIAEGRCDALKQQIDALVEAAAKAAEEIRKCDYTPARSTLLVVIASVKEKA